jgi:hypothetical protein
MDRQTRVGGGKWKEGKMTTEDQSKELPYEVNNEPPEPVKPGDTVIVNGETMTVESVVETDDAKEKRLQAVADAAEEAIADIRGRSFSARHPEIQKMINCYVCNRRHRGPQCKPTYKQMWVDEDLETGELSIQFAIVPLPGQGKNGKLTRPWSIFGAPKRMNWAKPRKHRRPSKRGLQIIEITRQLMQYVNKERFTTEAAQMLEAKRMAIQTLDNRAEREAKRIRKQQDLSRRINRG